MNLFFLHLQAKKLKDERTKRDMVTVYRPHNVSEGSEFLDDAIRTTEQPLTYTGHHLGDASQDELW